LSKSGRVRLSDLRRGDRLIHDCRDVGHDPAAWSAVLVEGLAKLVDAQIAAAGKIELDRSGGPPRTMPMADRGWLSAHDRQTWWHLCVEQQDFRRFSTFHRFASLHGNLITRCREQLSPDGEWYGSDEYNEWNRAFGLDDMIISHVRIERLACLQGFHIYRCMNQPRFGTRVRRLIRLFHDELARHVGTALVTEPAKPFLHLPPRLRQIMDCLLEGDGEKQVALRLGLSRHTVHDYIKVLYRRLGVCSRAEFMAFCLRHRPGAGPP
jgi:DNA-binding CsgD family transcriptional regulator